MLYGPAETSPELNNRWNRNTIGQTVHFLGNSSAIFFNNPTGWQDPPVKALTLIEPSMSDANSGCIPPYLLPNMDPALQIYTAPVHKHWIPYSF